jgi:hypothetical protein
MPTSGKRTAQVNVKMNSDDFALLQAAAKQLWPEAVISNSGILLGLARIAAKRVVEETKGSISKRTK